MYMVIKYSVVTVQIRPAAIVHDLSGLDSTLDRNGGCNEDVGTEVGLTSGMHTNIP